MNMTNEHEQRISDLIAAAKRVNEESWRPARARHIDVPSDAMHDLDSALLFLDVTSHPGWF
jgi:hypothetical protein